ncbi:MAG: ATP-binding cassette domain-containing protein, partial [Sulfuricella sp.]
MAAGKEGPTLAEFLAPGVEPQDLPELFPLLAARKLLSAFTALFHGGEEAVMARLLVLREIGARGEAPQWTPAELEARFAYVDQVKLDTILRRLKDHNLLVWDADRRTYQLSSPGRMALTAIEHLLGFSGEEDAELGFIASQIAAGNAVGRVSPEVLRHLLARLTELEGEFSQAVQSGSEFQLHNAQNKLQSVWQWMEKGLEVIGNLSADGLPDTASWRLAQTIHDRLSRMSRMTGVFQRELSAIARQRVHLSQGGLTSSELATWLRGLEIETLADYADDSIATVPESAFVLPDVMLDVAEYELCERVREAAKCSTLPPPAEAQNTSDIAQQMPAELPQLLALLAAIDAPMSVADAVVGGNYRSAAYRL